MRLYHNEEGVSEITSTALLIGVTILLVTILTAVFLSGPQPDEIPRAAIYARNESGKFALAHMGGDPLKEGNYRVYIDTGNGLVNATGDFTRPEGGVWSVGESITYNKGSWTPGRVVLTVISGETEMILAEMGLSGGIGIPPPTETPTTTPTPTPTQKDTLLNTGTGKSGTLVSGGYFEFRVTGAYSYVIIDDTRYDLAVGDTVKLVIGTEGGGKIYMSSGFSTFDYDDITLYTNGDLKGNGRVSEIWISSYGSLTSTLTLDVPPVNAWTEFKVDNIPIIYGDDNRKITLYNLMPGTNGVMNLNTRQETGKVYFTGSIASYTLG